MGRGGEDRPAHDGRVRYEYWAWAAPPDVNGCSRYSQELTPEDATARLLTWIIEGVAAYGVVLHWPSIADNRVVLRRMPEGARAWWE